MADRGFTIKDLLEEFGVELNMPPFLEGRSQLTSDEVKAGRGIASLYASVIARVYSIHAFLYEYKHF